MSNARARRKRSSLEKRRIMERLDKSSIKENVLTKRRGWNLWTLVRMITGKKR